MVRNIHSRDFKTDYSTIGGMLDTLSSKKDMIWPVHAWPPLRLDRELSVGAKGGHGRIRYFVEDYEPGRYVRFRFTSPKGFDGTHSFVVNQMDKETATLRHEINMKLRGFAIMSWLLSIRWLHDALLEDALDRVEAYINGTPLRQRSWSPWVRFLRKITTVSSSRRKRVQNVQ